MPGGQNPVVIPPDPDEDAQLAITEQIIRAWFKDAPNRDIIDCASEVISALAERRSSLGPDEEIELPPFVARHIARGA